MRRHPALQDLSRDHHTLLVHARRLRGEDARVPATEAARRYALFHAGVGRLHCAEEETVVAPFLPAALRDRMLREHAELERLAHGLPATQAELGERLRAHVRFEEDEAFAALQLLPESELVRLGALSREVRSKTRSPGEACHLT